jgi:hypothetical protein
MPASRICLIDKHSSSSENIPAPMITDGDSSESSICFIQCCRHSSCTSLKTSIRALSSRRLDEEIKYSKRVADMIPPILLFVYKSTDLFKSVSLFLVKRGVPKFYSIFLRLRIAERRVVSSAYSMSPPLARPRARHVTFTWKSSSFFLR